MDIGIIGTGNIGGTVGRLLAQAGHQIRFGARDPSKADRLHDIPNSSIATVEEAAHFGEVVLTATPYGAWPELARTIAPAVTGKVVIDAANPYPPRDGAFAQQALDDGEGAGKPVSALLPDARLVRTFSAVAADQLASEAHREGDRVGMPVAGDDPQAREIAAGLVRDAGLEPVIVGSLVEARLFDPGTSVYAKGLSASDLARTLAAATSA